MYTRRLLLNLALLILVAGLAALVFRPKHVPVPEGYAIASAGAADHVQQIRIERGNRPTLEFTRRDSVWRLSAPLKARANPLLMQALLELPHERSQHRYSAEGLDLSRYGLKPPNATLFYGNLRVELGADNPVNQRRYALSAGKLYLIPDHLAGLTAGPAVNWISLSVLPPHARIQSLQLPGLSIHLRQPGGWTLAPKPAHRSADEIAALLRNWHQVMALRVTQARRSDARDEGEIRIVLSDGQTLRLLIVHKQPALVLRNPALSIDYHFPPSAAEKLLQLPANDHPPHSS